MVKNEGTALQYIKHKDLTITLNEIKSIAAAGKVPAGSAIAIDIGSNFISVSPEDKTNIMGEYGEGTDYILIADTGDKE